MQKLMTRILTAAVFALLVSACAGPEFNSDAPKKYTNKKNVAGEALSKKGDPKNPNGEGAGQSESNSNANGENVMAKDKIAAAGMSLDLHAIVDISGSLSSGSGIVLNGGVVTSGGTDPQCRRLEALKVFFSELRQELGANPDARLSLTVFSTQASFVGTDEKFLNLSDQEFDSKYRPVICQSSGNTNASAAFEIAAEKAKDLIQNSPKKISSALVFTDGMPNVVPMEQTLLSAEKLRQVFPDRVFGILLGSTNSNATSDFMGKMTGSENRVRRVAQVGDLAAALSSFLK